MTKLDYKHLSKFNQEQLNQYFLDAVAKEDMPLIQYILTSKKLTIHADIHCNLDQALYSRVV